MKQLFILIIILNSFFCSAQENLVRNHSFEEYDNCPTGEGWLNFDVPYWNDTLFHGTPDYFNLCSPIEPFPTFGVPYNTGGFQYAKEGNAYGLIITFNYVTNNAREYLVTELIDTIIKGVPYLIKFHVNPLNNRQFATNKLGALLSKEIPDFSNNNLFEYSPQILNDGLDNPLTDTSSWIMIADTFISNIGGEKYLSIGNFFDDTHCDTVSIGDWQNYILQAVYFVDDVWVTTLDTTIGIKENNETRFIVFPNPATTEITITGCNPAYIRLCNTLGQTVAEANKSNKLWLGNLPHGLYVLQLFDAKGSLVKTEKVVKE